MGRAAAYMTSLPPRVRYDETLNPVAKLLFAEIMAMSDLTGFCYARNAYFAELFGLSPRTVSRLVEQLRSRGFVDVEVVKGGGPDGNNERRIWVRGDAMLPLGGIDTDVHTGIDKSVYTRCRQNVHAGIDKSVQTLKENNINNNTPHSPPKGGRAKSSREYRSEPEHRPGDFAKLWEWYPTGETAMHPKRGNKQKAIRAWDKLHPTPELIRTIAKALARQAESEEWQRGIGIPHLSTYLNNAGWEGWEEDADGN